jgi:hypothetical protein
MVFDLCSSMSEEFTMLAGSVGVGGAAVGRPADNSAMVGCPATLPNPCTASTLRISPSCRRGGLEYVWRTQDVSDGDGRTGLKKSGRWVC